jgi:hypothetical protein
MDKVIFDTNAYRYLVTDKSFSQIDKLIQKLKSREQKNGIETLISPIVAKELLAHVADKNDPSYDKCLKAIKALYLHSGNHKSYNMLASIELLISKSFFDKIITAKIETNKAIGQMIYHLATNPTEKTFKKLNKNLQANKNHVFESETTFAIQMKQFVSAIDPEAIGWQIFPDNPEKRAKALADIRSENASNQIALGYIFIVYYLLVVTGEIEPLTNEQLLDRAKELVKMFPEPIALFKQVMENLVNSEFNIFENSRANFVWDIHLMFNIGNHTVDGSKLYFVTADKAIIRSAIQENAKYSILTYDEYIEYLKK